MFRYGLLLAVLIAGAPAAWAQSPPSRPIHFIVPYPPGGGGDTLARLVAQQLAGQSGENVIVDNRPGAGGMVGTELAARAAPDGYTLVLGTPAPITVAPSLHKKMPYDVEKDLAPITLVTVLPGVVLVRPSFPAQTMKDLIAMAKSKPGQLTYGSSGIGGTGHLSGLMLGNFTHVDMLHVPYNGTGPALTALLAGQIDIMIGDASAALPLVKAGSLRALAVTSDKRSEALPGVPTVAETVPGYSASPFYGILAPGKTPRSVIDKRREQIVRALNTPEIQRRIAADGGEVIASTPQAFAALIQAETARWAGVLKEANLKVD